MQQATLASSPVHQPTPDRQERGERLVRRLKGLIGGQMYTDPLMT